MLGHILGDAFPLVNLCGSDVAGEDHILWRDDEKSLLFFCIPKAEIKPLKNPLIL
jgi:hypothetical protein